MASNTNNKIDKEEKRASPQFNTDIKLEGENWAPNLISTPEYEVDKSLNKILEGKNYTKDY